MKKLIHLGVLGLFFVVAGPALGFAGGGSDAGNGGSAIVCRDAGGAVQSVELLDFYEGRTVYGQQVDLGTKELDPYEKVDRYIQHLQTIGLGPNSVDALRDTVASFRSRSRFYSSTRLVEVPDSDSILIPAGCQQEQIAIQRQTMDDQEPYFSISQDLWSHPSFDNDQKAGLILHEAIYYLVLNYRHHRNVEIKDSRRVRYFLAQFANLSDPSHLRTLGRALEGLDWGTIRFAEYECSAEWIYFYDEDRLSHCQLSGDPDGVKGPVIQGVIRDAGRLGFDRDGRVTSITIRRPENLKVGAQQLWFAPGKWIRIGANDSVLEGDIYYGEEVRFNEPGRLDLVLAARPHDTVRMEFNPDGTLRFCLKCQGTAFIQGVTLPIAPGDEKDGPSYFDTYGRDFGGPDYSTRWIVRILGEAEVPLQGRNLWLKGVAQFHDRAGVVVGELSRPLEQELGGHSYWVQGFFQRSIDAAQLTVFELAKGAQLPACGRGNLQYYAGMQLELDPRRSCVSEVVRAISLR